MSKRRHSPLRKTFAGLAEFAFFRSLSPASDWNYMACWQPWLQQEGMTAIFTTRKTLAPTPSSANMYRNICLSPPCFTVLLPATVLTTAGGSDSYPHHMEDTAPFSSDNMGINTYLPPSLPWLQHLEDTAPTPSSADIGRNIYLPPPCCTVLLPATVLTTTGGSDSAILTTWKTLPPFPLQPTNINLSSPCIHSLSLWSQYSYMTAIFLAQNSILSPLLFFLIKAYFFKTFVQFHQILCNFTKINFF